MTDSAPHDLLTGYLLDALEPNDRLVFEEHLRRCAPCRRELAAVAPVAEALAGATPMQPPAGLEDALMAAVDGPVTRELGSDHAVAAPTPSDTARGVRRLWWSLPAAAAVAFVLGIGASNYWRQPEATPIIVADEQTQHVMELAAASDASFMPVEIQGANSKLVMSHKMDSAAIMADDVPVPAGGRVYQVWQVRRDGEMRSAGTFVPDNNGHVAVMLDGGLAGAEGYMLTVEPSPGSAHPTNPPLDEIAI